MLAGSPAAAQSSITISEDSVEQDFPNSLTFNLKAYGGSTITAVFLDYGTNAVTCVNAYGRIPLEIESANTVTTSWEWDFKDSGSLPAGAEVWWQWEIHSEDGGVAYSDRQSILIDDKRYNWETIPREPDSGQALTLWYHDISASFAADLQEIGRQALAKMKTDFGIEPSRPVKIILYNNADELREAALFLPEWVGGLAHPEYSILYIAVEEGDLEWANEVIYHEMAHLISGELTDNCLGVTMPTWLSEGFSVYIEDGPSADEQADVSADLMSGALPPLRALAAGFSSNSYEASRSYAQSGMILRFLVAQYGGETVPSLFQAIQDGQLIDDALMSVYGLSTDELDGAWRTSLGAAAEPTATPTPASLGEAALTPIPTLPLFDPDLPAGVPPTAAVRPTDEPAPTAQSAAGSDEPPGLPGLSCLNGNALIAGMLAIILVPGALQRRKQGE
jgi:hypothetical protein